MTKMKKNDNFEDLEIWKESMRICMQIYQLMKTCKDFGFKDQIQRAAVSVPSNIAEGFERQTNKEFIQFLFIAKGSCGELRTQLYLAKGLQYIDNEIVKHLLSQCKVFSSRIQNFIKARRNQKISSPLHPFVLSPLISSPKKQSHAQIH